MQFLHLSMTQHRITQERKQILIQNLTKNLHLKKERDFKWHEHDLVSEQVSELGLLELNSSLDESLNRTPCRKDVPGLVQLSPHLQNNLTHTLPSALAWAVALRLSLRTVIAPAPRKFYSFLCKDD